MATTSGIKSWAEDDRPREKLILKGASALSDTELLAILIASGTRTKSAVDLARETLALAANNLAQLGKLSLKDLQTTKGIGQARAITIAAAMELGRRRQIGAVIDRQKITSANDAAELLLPLLQDHTHELFCVLYLNNAQLLIKHEFISSGGLTATVADIRMILRNALLLQAAKIIVAHNHPSGNKTPSEADKKLTLKLRDAARQMDIELIDHIIVAGAAYTSFANEGLL
ncbi:MAG: DNA repair protein RadC [Chitinophagaceae bacterium]|nr:DNA repair protein RadC [Chitinophagaceae bacterium]